MCYFFFVHLLSFIISFFFFFLGNHRITIHNNRSKSNTLPQTRIYFKILRYCIILRTMSTKNGHKRGHRKLTYYFINFSGKIGAVFVTQDRFWTAHYSFSFFLTNYIIYHCIVSKTASEFRRIFDCLPSRAK